MPAFSRKPLAVLLQEEEKSQLARELGLFDLAVVGIGGSLGSAVFSVVGSVAALDCGPGVIVSTIVGSFGCLLTGFSYVKLSRAIPSTGGVYAYAYHSLGEAFAVVSAACLTLDYAISGSAVAASWGSKFALAVGLESLDSFEFGHITINLAALMVCVPCVAFLLQGVDISKKVSNFLLFVQFALVVFILVSAMMLFKPSNLSPLVPPRTSVDGDWRYGADGVFMGTVDCFFAFVGFNEVCCLAGESKDPKRNMPRAVVFSIIVLAAFTLFAGLGIVGMQHFTEIDPTDSFVVGLKSHDWQTAAWVVSIGELVTLPLVVFISFLPQSRLFYAMAKDGLLPQVFARVSSEGVLTQSNLIVGACCTVLAMVMEFDTFDEMISAGILSSFILCNCSLIMLTLDIDSRSATGEAVPTAEGQRLRHRAGTFLAVYCASCFGCAMLVESIFMPPTLFGFISSESLAMQTPIIFAAGVFAVLALASLWQLCKQQHDEHLGSVWLPAAAIVFNSIVLSSLDHSGFLIIGCYFACVFVLYVGYMTGQSASLQDEWLAGSSLLHERQPSSGGT